MLRTSPFAKLSHSRTAKLTILAAAAFQQLEVDYFIGEPNSKIMQTELTEVPILRMYGVTEAGAANSVTATFARFEARADSCGMENCRAHQ